MTFRRTPGFGSGEDGADFTAAPRPEASAPAPVPSARPAATLAASESLGSETRGYERERDTKTGPTAPDKCANVIASGSKWVGSLSIEDSVRIEGRLNGDLDAKGTVHVAEGAIVEANIKAAFVVISGTFKGEVVCLERLELLPRSKVQGELITKVLNVHEGAVVDGNIRMSGDREPARTRTRAEIEAPVAPPVAPTASNGSRASRTPTETA